MTGGRDGWVWGLGTSSRMNGSTRYCLLVAESFAIAASESVCLIEASGSLGFALVGGGPGVRDGGSISELETSKAKYGTSHLLLQG